MKINWEKNIERIHTSTQKKKHSALKMCFLFVSFEMIIPWGDFHEQQRLMIEIIFWDGFMNVLFSCDLTYCGYA